MSNSLFINVIEVFEYLLRKLQLQFQIIEKEARNLTFFVKPNVHILYLSLNIVSLIFECITSIGECNVKYFRKTTHVVQVD